MTSFFERQSMAKLGTKARPIIVRVQSDDRAYYVAETCGRNGWQYIIGLEPDEPEDISDLEEMLNPSLPARSNKIERNEPCPCGSGKKYKKCCAAVSVLSA
jgi:SWIM/SEC-C metal-binding protein